jgi:CheY-specific phosphatase CheX
MSVKFFGQFLIERGVVTPKKLFEAIALQGAKNAGFGATAVRLGFLTHDQALLIAEKQKTVDKLFGEIALQERLLTEAQIEQVLTYQKNSHVHIGEALVLTKALSREQLERELAAFNKEQEAFRLERLGLGKEVKHAALIEATADLTRKLLMRVARITARLGKPIPLASAPLSAEIIVSLSVTGGCLADIALLANRSVAAEMTRGLLGAFASKALSDEQLADGTREFLNLIGGNVVAKLAQQGLLCEISPPRSHKGPLDPKASGYLCPLHYPEGVSPASLNVVIVSVE